MTSRPSLARRRLLATGVAGLAAGLCARTSSAAVPGLIVSVSDHGAVGDGIADDAQAIAAAIRSAARTPGSTVRFPPGAYRLGITSDGEIIALRGVRNLRLLGERAVLVCDTPHGTVSMFKLTDCDRVTFQGLTFRDLGADRSAEWKGAIAIYLTGHGTRGNQNIRIERCLFEDLVAALMVSDGGGNRASNLRLSELDIRRTYYGLNFQNNGDDVVATGIRCSDVKRAYFPYGVTDHRIELTADNNATGFTDVLIKCYGRETADLHVSIRARGKRGGDAIVALDQQHPDDAGLIRNIAIELDIADADCALDNVMMMNARSAGGDIVPHTNSEWRDISVAGSVEFCAAATRMIAVNSRPARPGVIVASPGIAARVDRDRLSGMTLVEARP